MNTDASEPQAVAAAESQALLDKIQSSFKDKILASRVTLGDAEITLAPATVKEVLSALKGEFGFSMLLNVTATDYMDTEFVERVSDERYQVVYHLLNLEQPIRLRVKADVPESKPEIDSVVSVWSGANFQEREVYDMYGISFVGHPDQRRILMYEEFEGYPLRKDYPVQGKQPRVKMRAAEVENTARLMERPSLVQIGKRS